VELRFALVVLVACSGAKTKVEDAKPIVHPSDAAVVRAPDAAPVAGKGDVSIRVEWHDVPLDARKPGPCGPQVSPTTTWGIPDVVVTLDAPGTAPPRTPRVTLDTCLRPPVEIATGSLTVASNALQPAKLTLAKDGGAALPIELPIAGHEVSVPLQPGRYELVSGAAHAWVVAAPTPWTAVTDATGVAVLRDLPNGTYTVTAWSPASGRSAKGSVTVEAGQLADVTLQLQP
jgi:hypothetical protein